MGECIPLFRNLGAFHASRMQLFQTGLLSPLMQSHLVEEASKKIKNVQILINIISRRVRQLSNGHRPLIEVPPGMGFSDIALTEVIREKISYEATEGFKPEPLGERSDYRDRDRGFGGGHKAA